MINMRLKNDDCYSIKIIVFLALLVFLSSCSPAVVKSYRNNNYTDINNKLLYALPKGMIKIKQTQTKEEIPAFSVTPFFIPDPNHYYF
jgi:hypothetical protein